MAKWKVKVNESATYHIEVEAQDHLEARKAALEAVAKGEAKPDAGDVWTSYAKKIKE